MIIDKPAGMTSHDVVLRVRRALGTKRVGHTGTLDPFATGVMVVLVGNVTRLAQFLDKDEKEYEAVVRFGFETDTGDSTGTPKPESRSARELKLADVEAVLPEFRGRIEQIPPMYSAKKVEGKRLYELARQGVEIEREPVSIEITRLEAIVNDTSMEPPPPGHFSLRVACSAGTYIRTLAQDIGRAVGVGAHLAQLRRIRAGRFGIEEAVTLDDLASHDSPASLLLPVRKAVAHLPIFEVREDRVAKTMNGMSTRDLSDRFENGQPLQMVAPDGRLLAVGYFDASEKAVQPKVVLG